MSSLCAASSHVLTLRDEELDQLDDSRVKIFVERPIDISLNCNFIIDGPSGSDCTLEVDWGDENTALCGVCEFCVLIADSINRRIDVWDLRSKVEKSASTPSLVVRTDIHFRKIEYLKDHTRWLNKEGVQFPGNSCLQIVLLSGYVLLHSGDTITDGISKQKFDITLTLELFGEQDDPVVDLLKIVRRPLHDPRLSDRNVVKMREWLKDCDESHERCWLDLAPTDEDGAKATPRFLPTRMVDIGHVGNFDCPRLVITSQMPLADLEDEEMKYMALSYCWGPIDARTHLLKTTHGTLETRMTGIESDIMPKTFQEAIMVARALHIRYLWIDSLCILQDDAEDWQIESSKMAKIFSSAYLTLIVANGSGCNDGFLKRGLPALSCTVPLESTSHPAVRGQYSLRFRRTKRTSDKMAEVGHSKWITRGWTFQEERLARRVLIFGENKCFFDCRTLERTEDNDMYRMRPDWTASVIKIPGEESKSVNANASEMPQHWSHWQTLCSHYSYRELTFPEDKLSAVSGIAHSVGENVQSDYLAGLWKENLIHDLFWHTVTVATKSQVYRAPSWSWASVDGRVTWPSWKTDSSCDQCRLYCTILDVKTTPAGLDPFGAVKDGVLKVRGVLRRANVRWAEGNESQFSWKLDLDGTAAGDADLDIQSDFLPHDSAKTYYAIPVAQCSNRRKESETPVRGLLLEKNDRTRNGDVEYQRVGTFNLLPRNIPVDSSTLGLWESEAEQVIVII